MNLFVYGTLACTDMLAALLGRDVPCEPAVLGGYARLTLRMPALAPVPAIVPRPGESVPGRLLDGVGAAELQVLDAFELAHAGFYARRGVVVRAGDGRRRTAQAYVAGPAARPNLAEPWDREAFLAAWGEHYLRQVIPGFLASLGRG